MPTAPQHHAGMARLIFPALLGWVLGTALQLQQAMLFSWPDYGLLVLLALVSSISLTIKSVAIRWRTGLAVLVFGLLAFG
jgi:hypothetical protein